MNKVFLSYSRKNEAFVREFYDRLTADGARNIFFDKQNIRGGDDWVEVLEKALDDCDIFVIFLTPDYFTSHWTERERKAIFASIPKKKKKIIPLLVEACDEHITAFLRSIQYIDISSKDKYGKEYPAICRALGGTPGKKKKEKIDKTKLPPVCKLSERHYMPFRSLGKGFVGRVKDLWDIDEKLRQNKTAVVQGVGLVVGMGGVGKSQLAVEYANRFCEHYKGGVFWVDAEQGLTGMITRLATAAEIEIDNTRQEKEQLQQLWLELSRLEPVLIILDNFPERTGLRSWLPPQDAIHVLVTTRRRDLDFASLDLQVLSEAEGIVLLDSGKRDFPDEEAAELVQALGGLPLSLELAKNFLNLRTAMTIPDLLQEIGAEGEIEALRIFAEEYEKELPTGHNKEAAATIKISWDAASEFSQRILQVISLLAPAPVPRRLLAKVLETGEKKGLKDPLARGVGELVHQLSLIELDETKAPFCHRLIAAYARTTIEKDSPLPGRIVRTIADEMKRTADEADVQALRELEKVAPHAGHLLTATHFDLTPEQEVDMLNRIGKHHWRWGRYRAAEGYRRRTLKTAEDHFEAGHPKIAACQNELGLMLDALGEYKEAITYYEKSLNSDLKTYGEEHPEVAIRWNNLGEAWRELGDCKKAIAYYEKALKSDLKTYGEEHPEVAIRWNNLGGAYDDLGEYEKAIKYYEKALNSDLRTYGTGHPQVAIRWNNLGAAWRALGEYEKAIEYYEKALNSDIKTYGEEHPKVAIRWNNLGAAWRALGEYKKAIAYYEKALRLFERVLGEDHPHTKTTRANLERARKEVVKGQR